MARSIMGAQRRHASWSSTILQSVCLLSLTIGTVVAKQAKTAADYFVSSLPGQPDGPLLRMHAGHIEITPEHNGNLFFWLYENRHIADRRRTVIWLNGGPGCSSEDGALMEIGPYRVGKDGKLSYNDGSWDEFANLLFVDNPVGTGYSYVDGNAYLSELQEMADNFVTFLEKFFEIFPGVAQDDLYISGESYAGQHIPYIAKAILDRNQRAAYTAPAWNLKGLLIGNGWISAPEQYQSYTRFAYDKGLIQGGSDAAKDIERIQAECLQELNKPGGPERVGISKCEEILTSILDHTKTNNRCINMYDVRLTDDFDACGMNWPPDLANVTPYLRRADVVKALNIDRVKREGWSECSGAVITHFRALKSKSAISLIPGILEAGVPILLFSGDADLICNHFGTEDLISNMKWSGGSGFQLSGDTYAPRRDWQFEGQPAGIYQEARNLTYVKFYNASHMVPFDWPRRSRDMLDRFMQVDIASIGGKPADSLIDGQNAHSETSVGGHPNSTTAKDHEQETVHKAKVEAYYRSGEAVLVVVILISLVCAFIFWRHRRRSAMGVGGKGKDDSTERGKYMTLGAGRNGLGKGKQRDVEAGDFDENELDDLSVSRGGLVRSSKHDRSLDNDAYDLASDTSIDDSDAEKDMAPKNKGKKSGNEKS